MSRAIVIEGVTMSLAAAQNVEETGCSPRAAIAALQAGLLTREQLLAHCLDGADENRVQGWRDYVEGIAIAANLPVPS